MEDKVRQAKKKKREVKAFEFSLNRITEASELTLSNLNSLKTRLCKDLDAKSIEAVHIGISNEIRKVKNILQELNDLKNQIADEDLGILRQRMETLQRRLDNEVKSIIDIVDLNPPLRAGGIESLNDEFEVQSQECGTVMIAPVHDNNIDLASEVAAKKAVYQSWEGLRTDLNCLHEMFTSLAATVGEQKSTVEVIDVKVQESNDKVRDGARILQKIKKNVALPFLGAAVGTCIAGPVGLIAGFKIGAVSCLATGTLGYFSGKAVQTRVNNLPTIEIENVPLPPSRDQNNENEDSEK